MFSSTVSPILSFLWTKAAVGLGFYREHLSHPCLWGRSLSHTHHCAWGLVPPLFCVLCHKEHTNPLLSKANIFYKPSRKRQASLGIEQLTWGKQEKIEEREFSSVNSVKKKKKKPKKIPISAITPIALIPPACMNRKAHQVFCLHFLGKIWLFSKELEIINGNFPQEKNRSFPSSCNTGDRKKECQNKTPNLKNLHRWSVCFQQSQIASPC